jgi:hypothetical protein
MMAICRPIRPLITQASAAAEVRSPMGSVQTALMQSRSHGAVADNCSAWSIILQDLMQCLRGAVQADRNGHAREL